MNYKNVSKVVIIGSDELKQGFVTYKEDKGQTTKVAMSDIKSIV